MQKKFLNLFLFMQWRKVLIVILQIATIRQAYLMQITCINLIWIKLFIKTKLTVGSIRKGHNSWPFFLVKTSVSKVYRLSLLSPLMLRFRIGYWSLSLALTSPSSTITWWASAFSGKQSFFLWPSMIIYWEKNRCLHTYLLIRSGGSLVCITGA